MTLRYCTLSPVLQMWLAGTNDMTGRYCILIPSPVMHIVYAWGDTEYKVVWILYKKGMNIESKV